MTEEEQIIQNEEFENDTTDDGIPKEGSEGLEAQELSEEDYDRLSGLIDKPDEELTDEERLFIESNQSHILEEQPLQKSLEAILEYEDTNETIKDGSPEEIARFIINRDSSVRHTAKMEVLAEIQSKDTELYNAIEYVLKGGSSRDFYNSVKAIDTKEIKDEQVAKSVLKLHYGEKGINDNVIDTIINGFGTEEDLIKHAKEITAIQNREKEEQQQAILKQQQESKDNLNNYASLVSKTLNEKIIKGEIGDFIIPLEKRKDFDNYIKNKTNVYPNGDLSITTRFKKEELDGVLQSEWFGFVKGDLTKLILRQAATLNAQGLKKRMKQERPVSSSGGKTTLSLRDISNT